MRIKNFAFILTFSIVLAGCFGEEPKKEPKPEGNPTPAARPSERPADDNNPIKVETPTPRTKETKAETLEPVVKAYCTAINDGDDVALQKVYSRASWKALSTAASKEGVKSVAKYMGSTEPVGKACRVVNERIQGKLAEALVITDTYPNGVPLKFVKEGGSWKMTNQSSDFDAVRKGAKN